LDATGAEDLAALDVPVSECSREGDYKIPMRFRRRLLRVVPILAVLLVGLGVAWALVSTRPEPEQAPREEQGALVEVMRASVAPHPRTVRAQGTVIPSQQVVMQPEVGGRVEWLSEQLVPGGLLREGEPLLRLDDRDYQLAVRQQRAQVQRARTELKLEEARGKVAEREWEVLGMDPEEQEGSVLALREPQLRAARDDLASALSGLEKARLDVARTRLEAPFDALVLEESVDVGQLLSPQTPVATLVGTNAFWIQVSVPADRVSTIPGATVRPSSDRGVPVRIWQELNGRRVEREGRVVRLLGDLEPQGRMARLLVEIEDPLGLEQAPAGARALREPLLLGAYGNVEIDAGTLEDAVAVPREALRGDDTVYVLAEDGTLDIREVDVAWEDTETVLVTGGLAGGEQLVTSRLPGAMKGMRLRTGGEQAREPPRARPAAARSKARR
jgi:RND family efflux transporter MFP subunit